MTILRVLFTLTTTLDLELFQMDVKTTFLHGDLDKELYMKQSEGYVIPRKEYLKRCTRNNHKDMPFLEQSIWYVS